jgi:flagellar motor component MotA
MNQAEFTSRYAQIAGHALEYAQIARREGLLALDDYLDSAKADERDIFEYGIRFVIDGVKRELIEKILSNIISQEPDEQMKTLKIIQKEAALMIQEGMNPRMVYAVLNSYTGLPLNQDKIPGEILKD